MKLSFKQKLFFGYFIIFLLFTIGVVIFERHREKEFKTQALENKLDAYVNIIAATFNTNDTTSLINNKEFELTRYFPENLRVTIVSYYGTVLYDYPLGSEFDFENHSTRPEILEAKTDINGSDIRISASNNQKYLYYSKRYDNLYIRAALPYNIELENFFESDNLFVYFILLLFIVSVFFMNIIANKFGKSIKKLHEFTLSNGKEYYAQTIDFSDDELGDVAKKIKDNYNKLRRNKEKFKLEREKLLQHVHTSGEGLCFYTPEHTTIFYNGLFITYLNIIVDKTLSDPSTIFSDKSFTSIVEFLNNSNNEHYFETIISKSSRHFKVVVNVFDDKSFELNISDITAYEKTRLLKQEMTSNISHELRTPVTSIRGYLEIALTKDIDADKSKLFIDKAYQQTLALSELIHDINLLSKIEEAPTSFKKEQININQLISDLKSDMSERILSENANIECFNLENVNIAGNYNLLYSIFRNLTDNALRYAGSNIKIEIIKYNEDNDFYYFTYSDNGIGIKDETHLNRLFERFYRVNEGRTRDTGGSGLGLSIVKNAITYHKGTIMVKNKQSGGLEFLFKLSKN